MVLIVRQYVKRFCVACCSWVILLIVLGAITGCAFKGDGVPPINQANQDNPAAGDMANAWYPQPQKIRIYPSSRFILTENRPALEARVELLDDMGDSVKAPGTFHLELLEEAHHNRNTMQDKLYSWDVPLVTVEDQKSYFESVTRTYRFVLRLDREIKSDDELTLAITFTRSDGSLLQARAAIGPEGVRYGQ